MILEVHCLMTYGRINFSTEYWKNVYNYTIPEYSKFRSIAAVKNLKIRYADDHERER